MNNQDYYNKEYVPQVNKIGKITGYLGVLLSFTPALVLAVVYVLSMESYQNQLHY